jgi:hypothetical protein
MNYSIVLTQQELQVILQALGDVPLRVAGPTFSKIQAQIDAQKGDSSVQKPG